MQLRHLVKASGFRTMWPLRRNSPRHARRAVTILPVIACMPGEDVWFLRFVLGFLAHLGQGGAVADRLRNRIVGNHGGRSFSFDHLRGGPLLWARTLITTGHLFVGHTVCPGFVKIAARFPWWRDTPFCAPGYDYFRDGFNYAQVPVDLAPHAYARVSLRRVDTAAWARPGQQRAVLLYSDPLSQAASYFNFCRNHAAPTYNRLDGRRLTDWSFDDYFFRHALPSYAKTFISYQVMAAEMPGSVMILPHRRLRERPIEVIASILDHLAGAPRDRSHLADAVDLARPEHLAAVETALGRPLDRRRRARAVQAGGESDEVFHKAQDSIIRDEALTLLETMGVDMRFFSSSADAVAALPKATVA